MGFIDCDKRSAFVVEAKKIKAGATYAPLPDPRSHRILLTDLANAEVRDRLALV